MSSITLFLPKLEFSVGELVQGRIQVICPRDQKVRGIRLHLRGVEEAHFTYTATVHDAHCHTGHAGNVAHAGHPPASQTHTVTQTAHETNVFLDHKQSIWGLPLGSKDELVLLPGTYIYPFEFQIQHGALPSFNLPGTGKVEYTLKAYAEVPGFLKFDIKTKTAIRVLSYGTDLTLVAPALTAPRSKEASKSPTFGSGNISIAVTTSKGYLPIGGSLRFHVTATNNSSKSVRGIRYSLDSNTSAKARGHAHSGTKRVIKGEHAHDITKGATWTQEIEVAVPSDLSPTFQGLLLSQQYALNVLLDISWSRDLNVSIPIEVIAALDPNLRYEIPAIFSLPASAPAVAFTLGGGGGFSTPVAYPGTTVATVTVAAAPPPSTTAYTVPGPSPYGAGAPPSTVAYGAPPSAYGAGAPPSVYGGGGAPPSAYGAGAPPSVSYAAPPPSSAVPPTALPPGWEAAVDPASGKTFYVNHATHQTQWDRPY